MNSKIAIRTCIGVSVLLAAFTVSFAGDSNKDKGKSALNQYDNYYDKGRFDALAGDDGILTQDEWIAKRNSKEARAFGNMRWEEAMKFDADGDGALSPSEAKQYKMHEMHGMVKHRRRINKWYENHKGARGHSRAHVVVGQNAQAQEVGKASPKVRAHAKATTRTLNRSGLAIPRRRAVNRSKVARPLGQISKRRIAHNAK